MFKKACRAAHWRVYPQSKPDSILLHEGFSDCLWPAEDRHGFSVVLAVEQLVDVGVENGQRQLKDELNALVEEAVNYDHGALEGHDGQEEREEPGQRDGRDHTQLLHAVVQLRNVHTGQLLEHTLIHQRTCVWDSIHTSIHTCA